MSEQQLAKAYQPRDVEAKWYPRWEERGYFRGRSDSDRPSYAIVIPPPNVTGVLTLGHVLNNTLQDILVRQARMRGHEVCWVPGTDHAGIATQARVEAYILETEGLTRHDLGREKFLEKVWDWRRQYGGRIIRQLRRLGATCDWQRERFTLDPGLSAAVQEVFIRLYEKGLIYRGHRIINWCPKSCTALSDEEVVYREEQGSLWHFRYPLSNDQGHVAVATTRPETMLGDTAVAVHPDDVRYQRLIGQTVRLPLTERVIPIVADTHVDPSFGSGAVKVTPAHDPNDYEIGRRHNLPMLNVMHDDGRMNHAAGAEFENMDRFECRAAVVEMMQELGLLAKTERHVHQVGYSERGHVPVEPRLSNQWFVSMRTLAEPALGAVADGRIRFHPDRWVKTYRHWMENIRDWCISRQLWWGHRIPAYYCQRCNHIEVSRQTPGMCPKCNGSEFHQDRDVLDTWFSSWLWPFSVFGWPEDSPELEKFYPTDALVTGPDIIFFWVARMIMAGLEFVGDIPFRDVYFTSIIRDEKGRKLSKSLNNSPDPLEVIDTYGADALRFTIIYIAPLGQDIRYSNEKCEIGRNFANKIWNAARFRLHHGESTPDWAHLDGLAGDNLRSDDQWILGRYSETVAAATESLACFHFHEFAHAVYEFVWNEFCDWYLESAKAILNSGEAVGRSLTLRIFDYVMAGLLRLLHPVMPFVTEELYHALGFCNKDESIMYSEWPLPLSEDCRERLGIDRQVILQVRDKFAMIRAVRNIKAAYQIPVGRKLKVLIRPKGPEEESFLREDPVSLEFLLYASEVEIDQEISPQGPAGTAVTSLGAAYLPLAGVIDIEAEKERLSKQHGQICERIKSVQKKLANQKFVGNAPSSVVERERERLHEFQDRRRRLLEQIQSLENHDG